MEWVRARSVGFGLLGEQGAESIHSRFNYLGRNFAPLVNPSLLLEHRVGEVPWLIKMENNRLTFS